MIERHAARRKSNGTGMQQRASSRERRRPAEPESGPRTDSVAMTPRS